MARLPVITGFGGVNAAGRSSGHHGYRRMVIDALPAATAQTTFNNLAALTGQLRKQNGKWLDASGSEVNLQQHLAHLAPALKQGTLIRALEQNLFNPDALPFHRRAALHSTSDQALEFMLRQRDLPEPIPLGWKVSEADENGQVRVTATENIEVMLKCSRETPVHSAGQLPTGFDPEQLYPSRNHPRGLQLTVFAASDAINSLGIDWEIVKQKVPAYQIAVYAGSGMSQLDYNGYGGMMQARLLGKKVS